MDIRARDIHVDGIVQGVGFRPFVARLARGRGLCGWVKNAPDGVDIHLEAQSDAGAAEGALDGFAKALEAHAPAAARIVSLEARPARAEGCTGFEIRVSAHEGAPSTLVSPDLATCDACLAELFDPADRRYHYPFVNCTNCGPRFTIIEQLPYDRPATSMRGFAMCPKCAAEYADEDDRRYHAQPNACFACGPSLWFAEGPDGKPKDAGGSREFSDAFISATAHALSCGKVAAVKGLGGWHLACDARDEQAVCALRARKRRPGKPLAVMVKDLEAARRLCHVGKAEERLLLSPARPIVLLRTRGETGLAHAVAGELPEIGVMLPSTPVQHLLFDALGAGSVLVMTSGNRSGEPIVADDAEALDALSGIADVFLGNNRAIVARYDDSVLRVQHGICGENARRGADGGASAARDAAAGEGEGGEGRENDADSAGDADAPGFAQFVRRARGYTPLPLPVRPPQEEGGGAGNASNMDVTGDAGNANGADGAPPCAAPLVIFAAGSEQKATFAYLAPAPGRRRHAPDDAPGSSAGAPIIAGGGAPENPPVAPERVWISQHLGDLEHPGAWRAWEQAKKRYEQLFGLKPDALACDLHPEYLASKWARAQARKTGLPLVEVQHHHAHIAAVMGENALDGTMLGVALDGTGFGPDSTIWGCELLAASRADYRRLWHLPAFPLPGGAAAVLHPARSAFGLLSARTAVPVPDEDPAAWMNSLFTMENPQWRPFLDALEDRALYAQMIERRLNCPAASSLGRFFDAISALLEHARGRIGYDGEPACLLEAAALRELRETGALLPAPHEISAQAAACRARLVRGEPLTAFTAHLLVVQTIIEACEKAREATGLGRVALGGGCMVNRIVYELLAGGLAASGFRVYANIDLAPNDACLSYGQAIVARARLSEGEAHVPGDTGESAG